MGGTIAVTIRLPDGKEYRQARWTNTLSHLLLNVKFFKKDLRHVSAYIERGVEMQKDYKKHKKSGRFKYPMSPVYGGYNLLAPDGYGLVVVDMVNDVVLSSQGYTGFNYRMLLDAHCDKGALAEIRGLIRGKYATKAAKSFRDWITKDYIAVNKENMNIVSDCSVLLIDNHGPFTFMDYKEGDKKALETFLQDVKDLGFKLNSKEERKWKHFISKYE